MADRSDRSILAVPGIAQTSPVFRSALWDMASRNDWDVDAIATVMSSETGGTFDPAIRNPLPGQSATGLIQMTEGTAVSLGTSTAELAAMSDVEQLVYVEKYFRRAGINAATRPFDYYVVLLGQRPGQRLDQQVVAASNYDKNKALDVDRDGVITVADMRARFDQVQRRAGGRRVDASSVSASGSGSGGGLFWLAAAGGMFLLGRRRKHV